MKPISVTWEFMASPTTSAAVLGEGGGWSGVSSDWFEGDWGIESRGT